MGILMQSGGGKPTIMFRPVSLTGLYLRCAYRSAETLLAIKDDNDQIDRRVELAISTILWATLALEAGANEIAESIIHSTELAIFDRCKKKYSKPDKVSRLIWKWHWLFKLGPKVEIELSDPLFVATEGLIQLRHLLTHYKLQDTARKLYFEPSPPVLNEDGFYQRTEWNIDMKPTKIEPSLIESAFLNQSASKHYMSAREVFIQWELKNGRGVEVFSKSFPAL